MLYHQTMTPSWLEAHASYINRDRSSTTEQLTFNAGSVDYAALLKVPVIPVDVFENSTMLTVRIVVANDVTIGASEDSDNFYGLSDGISFIGVFVADAGNYGSVAPCRGAAGMSGPTITQPYGAAHTQLRPSDTFYPGQFVITLKLDARESWGSCYTAHDGGFVTTAGYNKRLNLSKGLTLEVYKEDKEQKVGIKFIEVSVVDDL